MVNINCKLEGKEFCLRCDELSQYVEYEKKVFELFKELYESGSIKYKGQNVKMKHYPPDYGELTGFYHMICENYNHTGNESDRKPNLRRCERIKWPKEIIEWCSCC